MSNQHEVNFPDCVMTRLPVGRAEGRIWLFFVVTGLPLSRFDPEDTGSPWRLSDHVAVLVDGAEMSPLGSGGSGSDHLALEQMEIRGSGASSITIQYLHDDRVVDTEIVELSH